MSERAYAIANEVAEARSWDARVAIIRKVPEMFGKARHQAVYAAIAERVYVPAVSSDFGYVHWRDDYGLPPLEAAYADTVNYTRGFQDVGVADLIGVLTHHPATLQVFRLLFGLTSPEFAEACSVVAGTSKLSKAAVHRVEAGGLPSDSVAAVCATVIDTMMRGAFFPPPLEGTSLRWKTDKPDTEAGWESVRRYAANGVPLSMFLHQRAYGEAFRQLLDATSRQRGDILETPVEELFKTRRHPVRANGLP